MFFTLTVVGMFLGPLAGFFGGLCPSCNDVKVMDRAKLIGGVFAWTFGAIAGVVVGSFICCNTAGGATQQAFSLFGAGVNGIVWTGWVASLVACAVGVYTASLHADEK